MLQVYYDDVNLIRIETDIERLDKIIKDSEDFSLLDIKEIDSKTSYTYYTKELKPKHSITVLDKEYPVIYRGILKTEWFQNKYDATNTKMGSYIKEGKTHFSVYAPSASKLTLILDSKRFEMKRMEDGTFYIALDKNYHGSSYLYEVDIYGETRTTTDPYAIASMPNRAASVVVDLNTLDLKVQDFKPQYDPILLEASVRDFSMDPEVNFKHRGQFLGMLESHGEYGMKHILDLGITHLQLMPVNDFETVNELDPLEKYNWGYDTMQFMSLEGSYSSNVHDPLQAMIDFATLVDGYHKENVGINLDVVFNHIYEVDDHPLHILVPYYYFRYNDDYTLSNGSFCGNEIASEMPMTRKLIVESTAHFVRTYNIDGYRFDLMGLLDVDTMNAVFEACHEINPNIMIYGEGWSMPTVLEDYRQASMKNYFQMPRIGHFNDQFRDTVAGKLNEEDLGYVGGNVALTETIKACMTAFSNDTFANHMFTKSSQSINYVECHDNMTFADKLALSKTSKEISIFAMGLVLLSQGVPFLQIGQSFFRDKQGDENSYKSPDSVNRIDWSLLDKNKEMNETIKSFIDTRKHMYKIKEGYSFKEEHELLHYYYGPYHITFNPTNKDEYMPAKGIRIQKH